MRRAVLVLLGLCVVLPVVIGIGLAYNTRPVSDADRRQAQAQVDAQLQEPVMRRELRKCLERPSRYGADPRDPGGTCPASMGLSVDNFLYRPQLSIPEERRASGLAVITVLGGLVMLIGTTFAGHDWGTGSMGNQLLFQPRRPRVWVAKGVGVLLVGLVTSAVVLAAYWGSLWGLAEHRGLQATSHQWALVVGTAERATLLIALAGVAAYALTMLFRSTVGTLGLMFGVTVGGSVLLAAVLGDGATRWMLTTNVSAVINDGVRYYDGSEVCRPNGECTGGFAHVSLAGGATYLGVLLVIAVALSLWSFRRRDVA
jgi:hypothetical protein